MNPKQLILDEMRRVLAGTDEGEKRNLLYALCVRVGGSPDVAARILTGPFEEVEAHLYYLVGAFADYFYGN